MRDTLKRAPQRQKVLAFLQEEIAQGRAFPSFAAIAEHMGWKHASSARDAVHGLMTLDGMVTCGTADGRIIYSLTRREEPVP